MTQRITWPVYIITLLCFLLICTTTSHAGNGRRLSTPEIDYLVETFDTGTFERRSLKNVFSNPGIRYMPGLVKMNVFNKEYASSYQRFLKPVSIGMAKKFARKWRTCLQQASTASGVDREVIVAILLVETCLGSYLGDVPVLSVFSSIILDNRMDHRQRYAQTLCESLRDRYLRRIEVKANWAQEELQALLTMHNSNTMDIHKLKGSYAGAFGIPQFLPSSYLKWAHNAGRAQKVDLFYIPDAIHSVGNYLTSHGWNADLPFEDKKKVLWNYNRSTVYVETVLKVAEKLQPAKPAPTEISARETSEKKS